MDKKGLKGVNLKMKKILSVILSIALMLSAVSFSAVFADGESGLLDWSDSITDETNYHSNVTENKSIAADPLDSNNKVIKISLIGRDTLTSGETNTWKDWNLNKFNVTSSTLSDALNEDAPLIVMKFDFLMDESAAFTNADLGSGLGDQFGVTNSNNKYYFGGTHYELYGNGKIGAEVERNKWYKIAKVVDQKRNVIRYYVDGELLLEDDGTGVCRKKPNCTDITQKVFGSGTGCVNGMSFNFTVPTTAGAAYVDNVGIKRMSYLQFSDLMANADGTITLKSSGELKKAELEKVLTVKDGSSTVSGTKVAVSGKNITITVPGMKANTSYTVEIAPTYAENEKSVYMTASDYAYLGATYSNSVMSPSEVDAEPAVKDLLDWSETVSDSTVVNKSLANTSIVNDPLDSNNKVINISLTGRDTLASNELNTWKDWDLNKFNIASTGVTDAVDTDAPLVLMQFDIMLSGNVSFSGATLGSFDNFGFSLQKNEKTCFGRSGGDNGNILAVDQNKWYTVTKVYDQQRDMIRYYIDGVFYAENSQSGILRSKWDYSNGDSINEKTFSNIPFNFTVATSGGEVYVDNLKLKRMSGPEFYSVKANANGTITMKSTAEVEQSELAKVLTVKNGETAVSGATVVVSGKNITITVPNMELDSTYTVEIAPTYTTDDGKTAYMVAKDYSYRTESFSATVATPKSNVIYTDGFSATKSGAVITVNGKVKNVSTSSQNGWLVIAAYDADNMMLAAKCIDVTNLASGADYPINGETLTNASTATKVRIMLWNSAENLKPYHMQDEIVLN